ncbi:MAG: PD40 domain-containing protein [Bacteroidales bacterium]|nr:PD40 domain-containing protein [Bacteroidales bacterium]
MRWFCFGLLILFPLVLPLNAQDWGRINELTYDAEYFYMTKQYEKAIKAYSQILKQIPDNANIKYKLGVCYLNTGTEKEKAVPYFIEASSRISEDYNPNSYKEETAPLETYFMLGSAYRVTNHLDKAKRAYRDYLDNLDAKDTRQREITEQYIRSCENAGQMMHNPSLVTTTNLGSILNGESADFNAVFSGDGQTVVYTSLKRDDNNIMLSNKVNGEWTKPKAITRQITSKDNFKTSSLSFDGTTLYLIEDDPLNSQIYFSTMTRNRWSSAVRLKKPVNTKMNETHASLSPDGQTLYFTSDRSGGEGDLDIYYSKLDKKGKWGKPVNMGTKINTMFNEETPFVSRDGKWLYFSSEGHEGMGGYDIFRFNLHETGSEAENLGYPVNTTDNDLFYFPGNSKFEGYYSRLADNGFGDRDIYAVEIHPAVNLTGKIMTDNQSSAVDTGLLLISIMDLNTYQTIAQPRPENSFGDFSHRVTPGRYLLTVSAPDYEIFSKEISIDEDPAENEMVIFADLAHKEEIMASVDEDAAIVETRTPETDMEEYAAPQTTGITETVSVSESPRTEPGVVESIETPVSESFTTPVTETLEIQTGVSDDMTGVRTSSETSATSYPYRSYAYTDEVVDESNDISSIPPGTPVSYTVQLFALSKPVDLSYFRNLDKISVHLAPDDLYKYTWRIAGSLEEAKKLCEDVLDRGYRDVIIRRRSIVPEYTIQVMAGKIPVNFNIFNKLDKLKIELSKDGYYRYFYGEYENIYEAREELSKVKELGYRNAFIKKL